nr:hypothetical protein [Lachnospiraceae bacterium]
MIYDIICIERAALYRILNMPKKAESLLVGGRDFYKEMGLLKRAAYLDACLKGQEYEIDSNEYELSWLSLDEILTASLNERKELQIAEEQSNNEFMADWIDMVNKENVDIDIIEPAIDKIKNMLGIGYYALYM